MREVALRLALTQGPENVRVDDIAEAAGVSPRTYNNYFSSREQAIVAAVTAERETRVAAAVAVRPAGVGLAHAVTEAVVEQYTDPYPHTPRVLAASVAAAIRVALHQWVQPTTANPATSGLVVPSGSLPDLLRTTLAPLTPALDAAEQRARPPH